MFVFGRKKKEEKRKRKIAGLINPFVVFVVSKVVAGTLQVTAENYMCVTWKK